jgi:hypothetical protein
MRARIPPSGAQEPGLFRSSFTLNVPEDTNVASNAIFFVQPTPPPGQPYAVLNMGLAVDEVLAPAGPGIFFGVGIPPNATFVGEILIFPGSVSPTTTPGFAPGLFLPAGGPLELRIFSPGPLLNAFTGGSFRLNLTLAQLPAL